MKKLFTYLFISFYLLGSTEAYQFLKIGYLVKHFIEHNTEDKIGLIAFINIHYIQPTVIDDDYAEDMKLPFKTHQDCHSQTVQFAKNQTQNYSIAVPYIQTNISTIQYHSPNTGAQFLDEIFQPPRVLNHKTI